MKKFILIFLSVLCIAGVGALGYLMFNAKSIASIEIEGQMQTIYVAGQDIDFENAKLKVTYKNGSVKFYVTLLSLPLKTLGCLFHSIYHCFCVLCFTLHFSHKVSFM